MDQQQKQNILALLDELKYHQRQANEFQMRLRLAMLDAGVTTLTVDLAEPPEPATPPAPALVKTPTGSTAT